MQNGTKRSKQESRDGAAARVLPSHQCGPVPFRPGVMSGLSLLLVPRFLFGFSAFSLTTKNQHLKIPIRPDRGATSKQAQTDVASSPNIETKGIQSVIYSYPSLMFPPLTISSPGRSI